MNHVANIDRRSFVASAAALGGGFALGFEIPFSGSGVVRAQDRAPEINAWVVIRPDDSVAIRIARAEMGQGTLTGLAQLVAEELECDWSKVTADHPTPGQNVARKRVWGDFSTTGSRGIRESNEYVRKGGAAARMMLVQAAANAWKVPAAECTAENSVITHKPSGRTTSYGNVAEAAAKLEPPTDVTLKDPKDWKIAGKPLKRLDTPDKLTGKAPYSIDVRLPGMLYAAVNACAVPGGKGQESQGHQRLDWRGAQGRTRCGASLRRKPKRRRESSDRWRGEEGRSNLRLSIPGARLHGAVERDCALHGRQMRGVDGLAERRSGAGRDVRGVGAAGREVRRA